MPDTKITALTAITTVDPANDVLPIVDVSDTSMAASGTTKKITTNQLLGASGTATLASATITGDLTARNWFVTGGSLPGVGNSNPFAYRIGGGGLGIGAATETGTTAPIVFYAGQGGVEQYRIAPLGVNTWSDGAGGTRMTLNSTGLGVGASPTTKLDVLGSGDGELRLRAGSDAALIFSETAANKNWKLKPSGGDFQFQYSATAYNSGYSPLMYLTATGNVGIGVTPSAWGSNWKANHVGTVGSFASSGAGSAPPTAMVIGAYNDNTNWKYQFSSTGAARYEMTGANAGSAHAWYTAPGGTVNNNITFTQAMTLDASGNLLVGKTASSSTVVGAELRPSGAIISTLAASTNADFALYTYSTGAGAARFYVGMSGTVFATNTTISAISDARLKENVQDIDVGLGAILALKPRKFDWKEGKGKNIKGDRGFIAQEVEQVFPQLVDEWADPAPEGEVPYKSIRQDLIPVLVKAIQELAAEVNALKNT